MLAHFWLTIESIRLQCFPVHRCSIWLWMVLSIDRRTHLVFLPINIPRWKNRQVISCFQLVILSRLAPWDGEMRRVWCCLPEKKRNLSTLTKKDWTIHIRYLNRALRQRVIVFLQSCKSKPSLFKKIQIKQVQIFFFFLMDLCCVLRQRKRFRSPPSYALPNSCSLGSSI